MKQRIPSVFLFAALFALTAPAANAETAGENVTEARPVLARPSPNGGISLGGAELFVAAFAPGWKVLPVKADPSPPGGEARPFEIRGEQTFFKGTTEWRPQSDGTLRGRIELECVVPGSALDFSGQGLQDAPAGKHGWLKAVDGHFEFEGLPGVEQRFYGANLCHSANFPDHDLADRLVDRLVRCGYNTVRIHHHDVAFTNWCRWAQAFLEHVNPYTGRAYKDEPGMPFVSLVNEGKLSMSWGGAGKALDPVVRAAWREFGGDGDDPPGSGANTPDSPHDRFDAWINRRIWERCSAFVRSLGCRALLTNDNNGRWHGEGEGLVPLYDYVDNHFYVDHPVFLDQPWRLPSKCLNANPIQADLPALLHRGYAKGSSKPYAISEWNFSGPGRYRGMGGLLTGALAAEQDWDALWRFAYAHRVRFLPDDGKSGPNYFDCATDPLIAASDRASVFLFLRGDALRANDGDGSIVVDRERGTLAIDTPRTCGGGIAT